MTHATQKTGMLRCKPQDLAMSSALAVGAMVAVWLGWSDERNLLALGLSGAFFLLGLSALTVWRGAAWFHALLTLSGVGLVGTHLYLSQARPEAYAGLFLLGCLLPHYRSWKLVVSVGLGLAGVLWWLASIMPLRMDSGAMFCALGLQYLYLAYAAHREARQERERFELDFLILAMGAQGPIRLNLDVLRADSVVGQRLKHIQHRMAEAIRQVNKSIDGVQRASMALSRGSEELSERTMSTASGLRDAAMCLEQINVIVQTSAQASLEARAMAARATELADSGGQQVKQVVDTMQAISRSSNKITEIISVIDGIAFQTNILALNASVEAARAGEQGRGFAVVASEVRHLALRSAEAAREIKSLINESMQTVDAGVAQVRLTGGTMEDIVLAVRRVGEVFDRLSEDSHEHAGGIDVVTQSVKELDGVTQQNIGVAATSSSIAAELMEHASQMSQVLSAFKLGEANLADPPSLDSRAHVPKVSAPAPAPSGSSMTSARLANSPQAAAKQAEGVEFF